MNQNTTPQLGGTAMELGEALFRNCALPPLAHMLNQINRHLPPGLAPEQRLLMWSGFFAAAIGCMAADSGKAAAQVLVEQLGQVADSFIPPDGEQRH